MAKTTEGKLYLTALGSLEKLELQFVPKELLFDRTANVADIYVVGRNNPLHQYTSGNTELNFQLDFHAMDENREDVIRRVRLLQSWTANDGSVSPVERIRLTFGRLFKANEIWIIKRAPAKLNLFNLTEGCLPQQAYVNLQMSLDTESNTRRRDIRWN